MLLLATPGLARPLIAPPMRLPPGLEYIHSRLGTGPMSIHVLKVDRANPRFKFSTCLAHNTVFGLEPLSRQVQSVARSGHIPMAAINGDFFGIRSGPYQGDPLGLQILKGELISSPRTASFWLDAEQQPHIARVQADFQATWPDGTSIPFDINQELTADHAVLYTPSMGPCTRTESGVELVLERERDTHWLPIEPGRTYQARILAKNPEPNSVIPRDKLILSISPSVARTIKRVTPGTPITLSMKTHPDLTGVDTAIGGGLLLITNGIKQTFSANPPRHPRSAIGWNARHIFLVVVDGRQKDLAVGMTLPELADLMGDLKCTDALNLDGGGSSTLW
ncbi:MAG: phosphodiester glycosidase family protein, partial [Planctomycetes bacterium]|nr:phosphodiester glycosidase family protein [Planctomycetota bacterium]